MSEIGRVPSLSRHSETITQDSLGQGPWMTRRESLIHRIMSSSAPSLGPRLDSYMPFRAVMRSTLSHGCVIRTRCFWEASKAAMTVRRPKGPPSRPGRRRGLACRPRKPGTGFQEPRSSREQPRRRRPTQLRAAARGRHGMPGPVCVIGGPDFCLTDEIGKSGRVSQPWVGQRVARNSLISRRHPIQI